MFFYLDLPFKFLFISSKGKALIKSAKLLKHHPYDPIVDETKKAKLIYDKQIRRYLGLGFLASFIPGTDAFRARTDYFFYLLTLHDYLSKKGYGSELAYLSVTPFYFLYNFLGKQVSDFAEIFKLLFPNSKFFEALFLLPFLSDLREDEVLTSCKNLVHTLLNPIRIISSLLRFIHYCLKTFGTPFEIGIILRLILFIIFLPLHLVVSFIEATVDLTLNCLDTLLLDPLRFGYEVIEQLIDSWSKDYVYVYIPISEESKGVYNIAIALDSARGQTRTQDYALIEFHGIENYSEKTKFYNRMKYMTFNHKTFFSGTNNFANLSIDKKEILIQLDSWNKLRLLLMCTQSVGLSMELFIPIAKLLAKTMIFSPRSNNSPIDKIADSSEEQKTDLSFSTFRF